MTLHWWMHWFWITCLIISGCTCNPLTPGLSDALEDESSFHNTEIPISTTIDEPAISRGSRTGKAIGHSPKTPIPAIFTTSTPLLKTSIIYPLATSSDMEDEEPSFHKDLTVDTKIEKPNADMKHEEISEPSTTESPVLIQNLTSKPTKNETIELDKKLNSTVTFQIKDNRTINDTFTPAKNSTDHNDEKHLEVTPLTTVETITTHINLTIPQPIDNLTEPTTLPVDKSIKNYGFPVDDDTDSTETSTVRALSLETAVGRRAADVTLSAGPDSPESESGLDAAAVAGICFGTLVLLALAGATSFVLYRRRYLNKPQTLNDKCSNPDSSGYIDDSTIRENSEEMYSLDNDSFLNSLEAMTIQNYWTDSVKHTKL